MLIVQVLKVSSATCQQFVEDAVKISRSNIFGFSTLTMQRSNILQVRWKCLLSFIENFLTNQLVKEFWKSVREAGRDYLSRCGTSRGKIPTTLSTYSRTAKAKFRDVPLYRKYKYAVCQTESNFASGFETRYITNEYMHIVEDGLSNGVNVYCRLRSIQSNDCNDYTVQYDLAMNTTMARPPRLG